MSEIQIERKPAEIADCRLRTEHSGGFGDWC
jgi:hypothetical protein